MLLSLLLNLAAPADAAAGAKTPPRTVLFLCTGNYYRSRLAEAVFNHEAERSGLNWRAQSRGVRVGPLNEEQQRLKLSPFTREKLGQLGISVERTSPEPAKATREDLSDADCVIALSEREHRPMVESQFGEASECPVVYWDHDDIQDRPAVEVMPLVVAEVRRLIEDLRAGRPPTGAGAMPDGAR